MSSDDDSDRVFKALANSVRRAILDRLSKGPFTTGNLCEYFATLDRCTVMQHLRTLEDAGLVIARRDGRERWNHLNALPIKRIQDRWIAPHAASAVELMADLEASFSTNGKPKLN